MASDFFTLEVWQDQIPFIVLFFMELSTRRVEVAGIASVANELWMAQMARNWTDGVDGFFKGKRYLIHDRDPVAAKRLGRSSSADTGSRSWLATSSPWRSGPRSDCSCEACWGSGWTAAVWIPFLHGL